MSIHIREVTINIAEIQEKEGRKGRREGGRGKGREKGLEEEVAGGREETKTFKVPSMISISQKQFY